MVKQNKYAFTSDKRTDEIIALVKANTERNGDFFNLSFFVRGCIKAKFPKKDKIYITVEDNLILGTKKDPQNDLYHEIFEKDGK